MADDKRLDLAVERRLSRRFRIEQDVTFRNLGCKPGTPAAGKGRTVDFSSRGLLFRTEQALCVGDRIEVSVQWPALLSGTCPLKFVALGRVLRIRENRVATSIEQYEFRTRRTRGWPK